MSNDDNKPYKGETNQTKNGFLTLMSRLVIDEKLPVRFMYKTVPEHLNDTGWRLFTGYEDEEFLANDQVNMIPMPLEKVVKIDTSLARILEYHAGPVWERPPESEDWERVYDYKIPSAKVEVDITNDVDQFGNETTH